MEDWNFRKFVQLLIKKVHCLLCYTQAGESSAQLKKKKENSPFQRTHITSWLRSAACTDHVGLDRAPPQAWAMARLRFNQIFKNGVLVDWRCVRIRSGSRGCCVVRSRQMKAERPVLHKTWLKLERTAVWRHTEFTHGAICRPSHPTRSYWLGDKHPPGVYQRLVLRNAMSQVCPHPFGIHR